MPKEKKLKTPKEKKLTKMRIKSSLRREKKLQIPRSTTSEVKKYNFIIEHPSPLSRRQKALRQIESLTHLHSRGKSNPKRLAAYLEVSQNKADNVIMELANAGYIQIGQEQSHFGNVVRWTNPLTITPGKDVTAFLNHEKEQKVKNKELPSTSEEGTDTGKQVKP